MTTIPTATYRVQLNDHFTFDDLASILDYLYELGISTIYASPVTTAFRGSQHGYDVADPLHLNPEIGTERQFEGLAAGLKEKGMNWLQDIVPNHMVWSTQNPWLYDVLERGKTSPYYSYFDIQPEPVDLLGDRLMAPFLGSTLVDCLQKKELSLQFTEKGFVIRYFGEDWPVGVQLYPWICAGIGDCPGELVASLDELVIASLSDLDEWQTVMGRSYPAPGRSLFRKAKPHGDFAGQSALCPYASPAVIRRDELPAVFYGEQPDLSADGKRVGLLGLSPGNPPLALPGPDPGFADRSYRWAGGAAAIYRQASAILWKGLLPDRRKDPGAR